MQQRTRCAARDARCVARRTSRAEIGASFAQQRYCLSMAAEASEIQGHVTVAINLVRSAPCIEEPAYRRCISIETGLVPFLVRLDVSDRSHDCLTKSRYYKTAANLCARGCVVKKKRGRFRGLASSKTLESRHSAAQLQNDAANAHEFSYQRLRTPSVQRSSAPGGNLVRRLGQRSGRLRV